MEFLSKNYKKLKRIILPILLCSLWFFIPGLLNNSLGKMLFEDEIISLLFDIFFALAILMIIFYKTKEYSKGLFEKDKTIKYYILPIIALIIIPFRVDGINGDIFGNPAWLYVLMMLVNALYQQYITFGLLQNYFYEIFSDKLAIIMTSIFFYLIHWIFLGSRFSPFQFLNALFMLALGFLFSVIRYKNKTLHFNLILHWLFYFIFI